MMTVERLAQYRWRSSDGPGLTDSFPNYKDNVKFASSAILHIEVKRLTVQNEIF